MTARTLFVQPEPWMRDAACANIDADLWFAEAGEGGNPTSAAKAVCARCPVLVDCLEYALEHREPAGVWGGATLKERKRILRARARHRGAA